MAVELTRAPQVHYRPVAITQRSIRPNLRLVSNNQSQTNAAKAAFNASMERAQLNQSYWNELLEKLRKAGGGGGGSDTRFDRITVSMMLNNFLSNKIIQAMLRNFGVDLFNTNKISNQSNNANQIQMGNVIQVIGKYVVSVVIAVGKGWVTQPLQASVKPITNLIGILSILSFQLNKLKEILEEDLKESIRKLDIKEKMKLVKTFIQDIFIEMKESIVEFVKSFFDLLTTNETRNSTYKKRPVL